MMIMRNHHDSRLFLLLLIFLTFTTWSSCLPVVDQHSIMAKTGGSLSEEKRVREIFQEWKEKHGKEYRHSGEAEERFQVFRNNFKYVVERNSVRRSFRELVLGLNKFADLTNEEFRNKYISKVYNLRRRNQQLGKSMAASCEAPSFLDWRRRGVVTGVKDQGQCGGCWAFSSTGAMEGVNALATGHLISLSEQELVDCDSTNDGCDGGDMGYAYEWVINNGGIDSESDYPYIGSDRTCNITKERRKSATIDGYTEMAGEENALLCAVSKQPVSVGIDGSAVDFQLYTGGIYDGGCSNDPNDINHAVLIVGYGSEGGEDYWIVKNSWGTLWGIEGYIYIRRNTGLEYGVCGINALASYPTKYPSSATPPYPSPPAPPPPPPSDCGAFSYCAPDETCCCLVQIWDVCLIQGCCEYKNGVCCKDTDYCCPSDYPICDVHDFMCLKNVGDLLGVAAKKRKMAGHKFSSSKSVQGKKAIEPILWKRNRLAASMR